MNQDKLIALFSQARLNVKITNKYKESVYIAIEPSKIVTFLDDLIVSFDKDLIDYAEKSGDKCPLENE